MIEPLPDTWHKRDLPVLRAIVKELGQTTDPVEVYTLTVSTGMPKVEVECAILALHRGGYVDVSVTTSFGGTSIDGVNDVTGDAYRLTGAWPSSEAIADKLLAALTDVVEHGDDEVSRDLLASVAGAASGVAMQ